jgi:hypothetical protein
MFGNIIPYVAPYMAWKLILVLGESMQTLNLQKNVGL